MEAILRVMKGVTGKGEEELRELMREELCQMSKEVSAMKEILKEPKARTAVKKSTEVTALTVEAEVTGVVGVKPKAKKEPKARTAVKKSAEVTAPTVEAGVTEVKAKKEPKARGVKKSAEVKPKAEVKPEEVVVSAEVEEEEVEVEEVEYEGVTYLRSSKGVMYDMMTSEEIGRWNEETKSIEVE